MALRTWGKVILTALGVAAATGAGQLGFGYSLGIVRLARDFTTGSGHHWHGQLAWVAWCAMAAAVTGAAAGRFLATRHKLGRDALGHAAIAAVAGLGAAVVAPLTMQPARDATLSVAINPVFTVGLTAVLGAVAGAVFAAAALLSRIIARNLAAFMVAVWVLALVSVAPSLGPNDQPATVRLGVLDLPWLTPATSRATALLGIPLFALLLGTGCAAAGRIVHHRSRTASGRHGLPEDTPADDAAPAGILGQAIDRLLSHPGRAACGAAGPGLLAMAYLLAGPGSTAEQATPYWAALIGLGAGVFGSALVTAAPSPADVATRRRAKAVAAAAIAEAQAAAEAAQAAEATQAAQAAEVGAISETGTKATETKVDAAKAAAPARRTAATAKKAASAATTAEQPFPTVTDSADGVASPPTSTRSTGSNRRKTHSRSGGGQSASPTVDSTTPASAALTEPTPDPLTAPLEQLQPAKRATRQRARAATKGADSGTAGGKTPARSVRNATTSTASSDTAETTNGTNRHAPASTPPARPTTEQPTDRPSPRPRPPGSRPSPRPRREPVIAQPETLSRPTSHASTAGAPAVNAPAVVSTAKSATGSERPAVVSDRSDTDPVVRDEPRKPRFGLLRRKAPNVPAQRESAEPERITPHEKEYVEWFAQLGDGSGSLRGNTPDKG